MRVTFGVLGTLAATLLATGAALAQQAGGAAPGVAPPGVPQPALPGAPPQVQPPALPGGGFQPGVQPFPGQPFDPQKMQEQMQEQMAKTFGLKVPAPALKWGGMVLEPAVESLLDQLNLPAGKGMVIASLDDDSAAAKAGLKKNDLLVKVNEEAVPGSARDLLKALGKSDAAVELVILRKGKEQTLKGVKLPEAAMATRQSGFGPNIFPMAIPLPAPLQPPPPIILPPPLNPAPALVPLPPLGLPGGQAQAQIQFNINGAKMTLNRDGDKVSADYAKDKVQFSLRGKMEANKARVEEITVKNGDVTKKYTKVDDVPESHRDAVNQIVRMLNGEPGAINQLVPPPPGLPPPPPGLPGLQRKAEPVKD